ncbi:MAG: deaminase, partial [Arenimonas sp.]
MPHDHVHLTLPAWVADEIGADTVYPDDLTKMALAVRLSSRNVREASGGPFGAALFTDAGRLLGVGVNRVVSQNCSLAHAEMLAFATAQQAMNQFRLNQNGERIVLATSSQPCAMCYGASFWAGIDAVLIGARADDVQSLAGFDGDLLVLNGDVPLLREQTIHDLLARHRDSGAAVTLLTARL